MRWIIWLIVVIALFIGAWRLARRINYHYYYQGKTAELIDKKTTDLEKRLGARIDSLAAVVDSLRAGR